MKIIWKILNKKNETFFSKTQKLEFLFKLFRKERIK